MNYSGHQAANANLASLTARVPEPSPKIQFRTLMKAAGAVNSPADALQCLQSLAEFCKTNPEFRYKPGKKRWTKQADRTDNLFAEVSALVASDDLTCHKLLTIVDSLSTIKYKTRELSELLVEKCIEKACYVIADPELFCKTLNCLDKYQLKNKELYHAIGVRFAKIAHLLEPTVIVEILETFAKQKFYCDDLLDQGVYQIFMFSDQLSTSEHCRTAFTLAKLGVLDTQYLSLVGERVNQDLDKLSPRDLSSFAYTVGCFEVVDQNATLEKIACLPTDDWSERDRVCLHTGLVACGVAPAGSLGFEPFFLKERKPTDFELEVRQVLKSLGNSIPGFVIHEERTVDVVPVDILLSIGRVDYGVEVDGIMYHSLKTIDNREIKPGCDIIQERILETGKIRVVHVPSKEWRRMNFKQRFEYLAELLEVA